MSFSAYIYVVVVPSNISAAPCYVLFHSSLFMAILTTNLFRSGLKGDCLLEGDSQYNGGDGMMSLQYSHEEFIADPICSSTAEPEYMGFNQNYDFDFFRTKVDVSSLITCMAVNMGILHFEELDVIEGSLRNSTLPNSTEIVYISQRFDFRYPGKSICDTVMWCHT